ncbi:MAG: hypothetical protein CHACPFDD_03508 [Phycisphaerae bacterium]|nr:hypothetical protein [Phycisphaerae bacterium]
MAYRIAVPILMFTMIAAAAQSTGGAKQDAPVAPKPTQAGPTSRPAWPPFAAPPQEMEDLAWLAGKWKVTTRYIGPDGKEYPGQTEATIAPMLGGSFLREEITIPAFKLSMSGFRSYDRFRKVYRFVWLDSIMSLTDVFEGTRQGDDLTVSNVKPGTSSIMPGAPESFLRFTQRPGGNRDEFSLIWEASTDGGKSWRKTAVYEYRRQADAGEHVRLGNFSVSLAVKDVAASRAFYEKLGFRKVAGDGTHYLIVQNETSTIGLFQGMLERNGLTYNPGWDRSGAALSDFDDVRDIQRALKQRGLSLATEADESTSGPASLLLIDPDGNPILIDQHVSKPRQ